MMQLKSGTRIRLIRMGDDPDPINPDSVGTVDGYHKFPDGAEQIRVSWDNGRHLALIVPPDQFEVIEKQL